MRTIESSVSAEGYLKPAEGWTEKFIYPPFDFNIANCMVTNFHRPKSAHFITTCCFGGYDLVMEAYKTAIEGDYKFLDYGDSMLIL